MIVANWMQSNPLTIVSDALVSDAKQLISEKNLHALPVVDNGRLRGLVTRANLLRTGHFVLRTQSPDEFSFFVNRLKVRDIMVRNPATVQYDDTIEHCLLKGQELGVAQFPVLEGDSVVGVISASEIFRTRGALRWRFGEAQRPDPGAAQARPEQPWPHSRRRRSRRRRVASDLPGWPASEGRGRCGAVDHPPFPRR